MASVANTSLLKKIAFSQHFAFIPSCWQREWIGEFHWSWILWTSPKFELGKKKYYILCLFSRPPNNVAKKKFHVVVVHGKEMYQKACYTMQNLSFNFQNLLLFDAIHFLVAIAVVRHPVLSTCVNCWESEVVGEGPNWPFFFRGFN